ncbi:MAG: hypothetical protein K1W35_12940 [Lachnospiraceae bacterium]
MKNRTLKKYKFTDGHEITTNLSIDEALKRMNRLDTLRVLTEQYDCEEGISITKKALRAYDKKDNFTGIIHLTFLEKDWLSYMLESDFNDDEDIKTIKFYCGITEDP